MEPPAVDPPPDFPPLPAAARPSQPQQKSDSTSGIVPPLAAKIQTKSPASFASLLRANSPAIPAPATVPISTFKGDSAVVFPLSAMDFAQAPFQFTLVGKFLNPKPAMGKIRYMFRLLNLKAAYTVGSFDDHHIMIKLSCMEDYQRMFGKEWTVGKTDTFRTSRWTPNFDKEKDSSVVPVWLSLHNLPICYFNVPMLSNIAAVAGRALRVDSSTINLTRPNVARICVEVDLLKTLPKRVWIAVGEKENGFFQRIEYENLPKYCSSCFKLGHEARGCKVDSRANIPVFRATGTIKENLQHPAPTPGSDPMPSTCVPSSEPTSLISSLTVAALNSTGGLAAVLTDSVRVSDVAGPSITMPTSTEIIEPTIASSSGQVLLQEPLPSNTTAPIPIIDQLLSSTIEVTHSRPMETENVLPENCMPLNASQPVSQGIDISNSFDALSENDDEDDENQSNKGEDDNADLEGQDSDHHKDDVEEGNSNSPSNVSDGGSGTSRRPSIDNEGFVRIAARGRPKGSKHKGVPTLGIRTSSRLKKLGDGGLAKTSTGPQ